VSVPAYWHAPDNVGDVMTKWLVEQISGDGCRLVPWDRAEPKYFVTGSILRLANAHTTVWGAGIAYKTDRVSPAAKILAVRGPLSRARALECGASCPEVYGDPALLSPRLYRPSDCLRYGLGVVPHLVDHDRVARRYAGSDDVLVVDVRATPMRVINQITSCARIVSSSLHGLLLAAAYGIPFLWAEFSDGVLGDGTKFRDFYLSVGLGGDVAPANMRGALPNARDVAGLVGDQKPVIDTEPLWRTCPFREQTPAL